MRSREIARLVLLIMMAMAAGCRNEPEEEQIRGVELETEDHGKAATAGQRSSEPPSPPPPPTGQPDPRAVYYVPLEGDEPQRGPDDALFTIVAFGDYQCPFCKNMEPVLEQLLQNHPGELRVVWMDFPLSGHRHARAAATAALEAQAQKGDEGYWQMHDKLFENQRQLDRQHLEKYAKEIGLDLRAFREALDTDKYASIIDRRVALGQALGFPGTPAFYLNGRYVPGLPLQTWEGALQLRRPTYERLVRNGVPKSRLYEVLIADGKKGL